MPICYYINDVQLCHVIPLQRFWGGYVLLGVAVFIFILILLSDKFLEEMKNNKNRRLRNPEDIDDVNIYTVLRDFYKYIRKRNKK